MIRRRLLVSGMLGMGALALISGRGNLWSDENGPTQAEQPLAQGLGRVKCMERPEHWSTLPKLVQGNELICSRFLRFETPDGRTINARMFLTEFHPRNLRVDQNLSVDKLAEGQTFPSRMACIGHEISVDEGYAPDFDVPAQFVTPSAPCAFTVDLGAVQCFIRTTAADKVD